jgi:hypothetical protein
MAKRCHAGQQEAITPRGNFSPVIMVMMIISPLANLSCGPPLQGSILDVFSFFFTYVFTYHRY